MERREEYQAMRLEEQKRPVPAELTYLESRVKAKARQHNPNRRRKLTAVAAVCLCLVLGTAMAWRLGGFDRLSNFWGGEAQQMLPYYQTVDASVELERAKVDVEGVIFTTHGCTVLSRITAKGGADCGELNKSQLLPYFWRVAKGGEIDKEKPFESFMAAWEEGRDMGSHVGWNEWLETEGADSIYCLFTVSVEQELKGGADLELLLYFPNAVDGVQEHDEIPGGTLIVIPAQQVLEEKQVQTVGDERFAEVNISPALITVRTTLRGDEHVANRPLFEQDPVIDLIYQDGNTWNVARDRVLCVEGKTPYVLSVTDDGLISMLWYLKESPPDLDDLVGVELDGTYYSISVDTN